ncbi:MAG: hypothetical protein GTO18_19610 [Anaerolineales bacterium]|nr:hypothetical protein [Anaerolineales bacterium]
MKQLHVRLFGKFAVHWDSQPIEGIEAGKAQELFSYLMIYRDQPHPRETLADLIWDANSTAQARKYLRQALWQLQNALQSHSIEVTNPLLLIEQDWIRVNPDAELWLDVARFEEAYNSAQGLRGSELDAETLGAVDQAVQLYNADLLLGWYQDWCLYERERLQNMCLAMLDKLMGYCEAHGMYETGLIHGTRILSFDRARERTHRRLMRLHYLAGDRTAALRQYERCALALEEELGVKPATRTSELYSILSQDASLSLHHLGALPIDIGISSGELTCLPRVVAHLKQLLGILDDVQHHVEQDIESIEQAISKQS